MSELEDCKLVTRGPDWIWISPRSFFNSEMALHLSGCFSVTPRNKVHLMSNKSVTQWLVLTAGLDSQKKKKRGSPKAFIDLYYVCASKEFIPCLYHQVINPNGKVSLIYKIFASREYGQESILPRSGHWVSQLKFCLPDPVQLVWHWWTSVYRTSPLKSYQYTLFFTYYVLKLIPKGTASFFICCTSDSGTINQVG